MSATRLRRRDDDVHRVVAPAVAEAAAPQGGESTVAVATPTMTVGHADDPLEADADRRAETALGRLMSGSPAGEHSHGAACGHVHRSQNATPDSGATIGPAGGDLDAATAAKISGRRGGGRPLDGETKGRMETAFGTSLGSVRIHDDSTAAGLSAQISAEAFTTGSDIFFGAGRYAPETPQGERVLAHELGHVLQGGSGGVHRLLFGLFGDKDAPPKPPTDKQKRQTAIKESKKSQKTMESAQKADRKEGQAGRAKDQEDIYSHTNDQASHQQAVGEIQAEFELALAFEQANFDYYIKEGLEEEKARSRAYQETWLQGDFAESLKKYRPPRETASERLRSKVKQARTDMNVREMMDDSGALGQLLSKEVERTYEQYVAEITRLQGDPDNLSSTAATAMAEKNIWANASEKARKLRPVRGSELDKAAIEQATSRMRVRPTPVKQNKTTAEKAQGPLDKIGTGLDVTTALSQVASTPLSTVGAGKDKKANPPKDPEPSGLETKIPVVGPVIKAVQSASNRVEKGKSQDDPVSNKAKSDETRAGDGISTIIGILNDVYSTVTGGFQFAAAVQKAQESKSARDIMTASKTAADGARSMVSLAAKAAKLASVIDPGVSSAVASVVPGLNIAVTALQIVSNAISMTDSAMRVSETNTALADARARKGNEPVDVMVMPMLRVLQSYTIGLEKSVWSTSVSIAELATSIATVASGGGYGIPAAVQAGVKAVDTLHTFGHFIAKQVLVSITKKTQKDSLQSLEGSAEQGFKHDPAMAVDGIILRAAGGDKVAQKFLGNYDVDGKKVTPELLAKIQPGTQGAVGNERLLGQVRSSVMQAMGDSVEPMFFYQEWRKQIGTVVDLGKSMTTEKYGKVGTLAADRTALDGKSRGLGWKLKMMFKSEEKLGRSTAKTEVAKKAGPSAGPFIGPRVLCTVKGAVLLPEASASQQEAFLAAVKKASDDDLLAAARDPRNAEQWQEFLLEALQDRIAAKAGAGSGAP